MKSDDLANAINADKPVSGTIIAPVVPVGKKESTLHSETPYHYYNSNEDDNHDHTHYHDHVDNPSSNQELMLKDLPAMKKQLFSNEQGSSSIPVQGNNSNMSQPQPQPIVVNNITPVIVKSPSSNKVKSKTSTTPVVAAHTPSLPLNAPVEVESIYNLIAASPIDKWLNHQVLHWIGSIGLSLSLIHI